MTNKRHHNKPAGNDRTSPITVESVVEIPADPTTVFRYLANLENNPVWNWAVTETRPLDGGPRTGSRYMQSHSSPRRGKEMLEITSYREGEHLQVTSNVDGTIIVYHYDLFPAPEGKTHLKLGVDMHSARSVGRPDLFAERLGMVLGMNLESLRGAIIERQESSARSGAA